MLIIPDLPLSRMLEVAAKGEKLRVLELERKRPKQEIL